MAKANRKGGEYLHIWSAAIESHMYAVIKAPVSNEIKKAMWMSLEYHATNRVGLLYISFGSDSILERTALHRIRNPGRGGDFSFGLLRLEGTL